MTKRQKTSNDIKGFYIEVVTKQEPTVAIRKPKHGKWIKKEHLVPLAWDAEPLDWDKYDEKTHSELQEYWHCSECDYEADRHFRPSWEYCPSCGSYNGDDETNELEVR